jgi:hypothetical protein
VRAVEVENRSRNVRFEVFTAVTMKKAVFWAVAPCRGTETSVNTISTRRHTQKTVCFISRNTERYSADKQKII